LRLEVAATSSRPGASAIPLERAEPAQPVAPATQIRMFDMGFSRGSIFVESLSQKV
jgi:hypothetical protein